jgi:hypothetical protein
LPGVTPCMTHHNIRPLRKTGRPRPQFRWQGSSPPLLTKYSDPPAPRQRAGQHFHMKGLHRAPA